MKKLLILSIVAFLLYLAVQDADAAAQLLSNVVDMLGSLAEGFMNVLDGMFARR